MLKNIFKLLPFFIVECIGKKYGEKTTINGKEAVIVFSNIYILL